MIAAASDSPLSFGLLRLAHRPTEEAAMPEYLSPGVYVEEMDSEVKPIPGISTSIDSAALESLAGDFRKAMQGSFPQWTDPAESDPGVSLLEVFAFLSESLIFRTGEIPERGRTAAL